MRPFSPKHRLSLSVGILGFTVLVSQMLFMRELVVVFYGNELSLGILFAVWLFWTALGSGLLPKLFPIRTNQWGRLRLVFFLLACIIPLTDLGIRQSRIILHATSGEIIVYDLMLLTGLIVFAPLCSLSGYAYAAACRLASGKGGKKPKPIAGVYALEAFGSAAGGVLASLLLFPDAAPVQIIAALSGLILFAGLILPHRTAETPKPLVLGLILFLGAAVFIFTLAPGMQTRLDRFFWKSGEYIVSKNTAYGNITLARMENQISFFENGQHLFTCPDLLSAEESVHHALLEHPFPQKILLIGGSLGEAIEQAFQHPSVKIVHGIELDPEIIRLARKYLPASGRTYLSDPRVTLHLTDARHFLNRTRETYDAILLNLPNPYTAQLNRFYTVEFFHEVRAKLNAGGVFSFQLPSSENAVGKELSDFLSTVSATLSYVFPKTVLLPGDHCRFIASLDGRFLTSDPAEFAKRIRDRNLKTVYVQEYYMAYQFSKERREYLSSRLHPVPTERLNRDLKPLAFWYDLVLWARQFTPGLRNAFGWLAGIRAWHLFTLLLVATGLTGIKIRKNRSMVPAARLSVYTAGLSGIALELIGLLMYQTFYGVLYQDMAVMVAGYMAGLGIGSMFALKRKSPAFASVKRLIFAQCLMGLLPLILGGFFLLVSRTPLIHGLFGLGIILFVILNTLTGFLGGYVFMLANHALFSTGNAGRNTAGSLYALDLLGSLLGALITTAIAVPLLGILTTLLGISTINLAVFFILWTSRCR